MEFESDISIVNPGCALHYEARGQKTTIDANFIVSDTLCEGYPVTFVSNSINASSFSWDFTGTGIFINNAAEPTHTYTVPGTYNVVMVATGCAGVDTTRKTVTVIPIGQNNVNFTSEYTNYTTNDEVVLSDITSGCITGYQWVIEPAGATFLNGSDQEAEAHVTFATAGQYTVKLFTSNGVSNDSMVKINYLTINEICTPKVLNTLTDMGISRVVVGDIDNSTPGTDGYTDYAAMSTTMMKGESYEIKVFRPTTSNEINRRVWIDYNADGDFDDAGELVASENAARTASFTETITVPRNAADGMVTLRIATSYRFQDNLPCGTRSYGETEDYRINLVNDMEAPVITLNGADTIYINRNNGYNELGATATDNLDGNLTPSIIITQSVDTTIAGTYVIEYDVTDTAGNAATTVVRVLIVHPDAPSIVLNGLASDTMDVFTSYNDLNVLGIDFNGDTLVAMVQSNLDTAVIGTYTITYTVTDQNGRSASISRDVTVIDQVAPIGILLGMDTVTVEVFGTYMEAGVDISDNYCTNGNTMNASTVDLTTLGTKTITYTITDCNGNTSMITRVIQVVDTEAPVIRLKASPAANIVRLRTYTDSGYVLSDNYDPNTNITVETITTLVDTETPGIYTLQYKATDGSGNIGYSEIRFIYVSDNVGIDDQAQIKLNVYPNPNTGKFAVETDAFSGNVQVTVIDMYGKTVKLENIDFNGSTNLDISGMAKGTYMVMITQGDQAALARIVLQ